MKRTTLNFVIDLVSFIGFAVLTTTGVLMRYILPPGSGHRSTIWGFDRHEWGGIHFWIAVVFFAILVFHLLLHWRWIVSIVKGRPHDESGFRVGLGVIGLIAIIAFSISPLLTPVKKETTNKNVPFLSSHQYEDISIRGSMTLKEVEETTGVPIAYLLKALNLPKSIAPEKQLGPLKREYGFEINDVRDVVKEYKKE